MLELIPHAQYGTVVSLNDLRAALNVTTNTTALLTTKTNRLDLREGRDYWRTPRDGTLLTLQAALKIASSCYGDRANPSKGIIQVTQTLTWVLLTGLETAAEISELLKAMQEHHEDALNHAFRHHRTQAKADSKLRGEDPQGALEVCSAKHEEQVKVLKATYERLFKNLDTVAATIAAIGHVDDETTAEHPSFMHSAANQEEVTNG